MRRGAKKRQKIQSSGPTHLSPTQIDPTQIDPTHIDPTHIDPTHIDPTPTLFETHPSVIHACVGKYLTCNVWDYINLAMCTKRLWTFYCENDVFVRCMRSAWSIYNNSTKYNDLRNDYLLSRNNLLCMQWVWNKERKHELSQDVVNKMLVCAASHGNLEAICVYAPFTSPQKASTQIQTFYRIIHEMALHGKEREVLYFVQNDCGLKVSVNALNPEQKLGLFCLGVRNVLKAPSYFQYARNLLESIPGFDGDDQDAQVNVILSSACEAHLDIKKETFLYFWKQTPYVRHAKRLISFMLDRGNQAGEIPWLICQVFTEFCTVTKEEETITYKMDLDGGGTLELSKRPFEVPNEMDCLLKTTTPNQGRTVVFLKVPKYWC